jgi:DNA-directed RNA polymerase subunit RPC12/RpoP
MDPRNIFDYKCHTCKQTKEPNEYGFNSQTKTLRVTCNVCHQKRTDREDILKKKQQALRREFEAQEALRYRAPVTSDEEPHTPMIINLPNYDTTTEEHGLPSSLPANYYHGEPEPEPAPEITPEPSESEDLSMFLTMDF